MDKRPKVPFKLIERKIITEMSNLCFFEELKMYLYLKPILVLKIRRAVSQNKILSQDYMKVYSYKLANEQM
jgi:hypothetical protein